MPTCVVALTSSLSASMVRSREESTRVKPRAESWNTARIWRTVAGYPGLLYILYILWSRRLCKGIRRILQMWRKVDSLSSQYLYCIRWLSLRNIISIRSQIPNNSSDAETRFLVYEKSPTYCSHVCKSKVFHEVIWTWSLFKWDGLQGVGRFPVGTPGHICQTNHFSSSCKI